MIKREALNLFIQSNRMAINECKSFDEQETLYKNFLIRLLDSGKITLDQYSNWTK